MGCKDLTDRGSETGFTLLEILLVIVILSVTTMMVAPSFVSVSSPSLQGEAKRFVQIVRLASDEAMLSGWPFRLSLKKNSYLFESPDTEGVWKPVEDETYRDYQFPEAFTITEIRPESGLIDYAGEKEDEEPVIGRIMLLPEGAQLASEIQLSEADKQLTILVQSGPNGIRIKKAEDE